MGGDDDLHETLDSHLAHSVQVALEQTLEGLLGLPFRMLRREFLHPIEREEDLRVRRILQPERPVVVERRDALGRLDVVSATLVRYRLDKLYDRLLCGPGVPRRQRIARALCCGACRCRNEK
jgi:hypothetical protein